MRILQLSSGDLVADRRASYAAVLAQEADHQAAAELMEQALELVPGWAAGDKGSTLKPDAYMALGGPWANGQDPAGA